MNIWNLTKKDLLVFLKDRGAMLWLFVLPLVFLLIFAGLAGMSGGAQPAADAADARVPLMVVNLDEGGEASSLLVEEINAPDAFKATYLSLAEAEARLNRLQINRYLLIPADFSANLAQRRPAALSLITHPNSNAEFNATVLHMINGLARDVSLELQILDGIQQMGAMQAGQPASTFDAGRVMAQARSQFEASREQPLLAIRQVEPARAEPVSFDVFDLGRSIVPGIVVLFVFLSAQTVARNIFEERKTGTLRRLLSAPLSRSEMLAGKMLPVWLLTLVQIVVIFLAGALLLPLFGFGRLGLGSDPLALALTSLVIALCSTSLGIFIAGVARTEGQIVGGSNALLWVAGFLGGTLVPLFIIQSIPSINAISRLVPHSWATSAYYDLLARGRGLVDVLPNLAVLLLFTGLFFFIGVRRFRYE